MKINFCCSFVYIATINWQSSEQVTHKRKYNCELQALAMLRFQTGSNTAVVVTR
jgi:hypothetical protein